MNAVRYILIALLVLLVISVADQASFMDNNVNGLIIDKKFGVVSWPGSPKFSGRLTTRLIKVVFVEDWDGTGKIQKLTWTDRNGLVPKTTTFMYATERSVVRVCEGRVLTATECSRFYFHPKISPRERMELYNKTGTRINLEEDPAAYFMLAQEKAMQILHGGNAWRDSIEFPTPPVHPLIIQ